MYIYLPTPNRPAPGSYPHSRVVRSVLFEHLYGYKMPGAHNAMGDVYGLESVLSAPGISER